MNLFVLRHGIASDPGENGLPKNLKDAERPLSAKGKQRMWQIAAALRAMELKFDVVATSPLLRARQTALIISESMELRRKLLFTDNLMPDGNPKLLVDQLNDLGSRAKNVLLVGHEPYLSRLISLLVAGDTAAAIDLRKGGLAKLEIEALRYARCATLTWLLTPKQLLLMK
ncbi:MAG: phosphohistidine phosphatase SixA [Verrucomicrobiota bacterium]|jgi:phosphohistidine phosphatase